MEVKAGYKRTEVGIIPEDWECTSVREIASPIRNAIVGGPFGSDLVSTDYVEDGVPVIRGQNLGTKFISGSFVFVTKKKAKSLEANLAHPSDLVFTQRGTLGQVSLVPDQNYEEYLVSQSQMKLTVNHKLADPVFFYYLFTSSEQQQLIRENTIQTGVPHINLGILRLIPIQRPSLVEQQTIAEALSDADALIEALEQLIAKKRQVKQGAMQELLTPPSAAGQAGKRRLSGFTEDWKIFELREIVTQFIVPMRDKPKKFRGEIPWCRIEDFDGKILFGSKSNQNVDNEIIKQMNLKVYPVGTLLVSCSADLGRCAIVGRPLVTNQTFIGLFFDRNKASNEFFYYFMTHHADELNNLSSGTTISYLSREQFETFKVKVPSTKSEQTAIAEILSDMDAEIAALEGKLSKARQVKQGMMQELLTGRIRLI